MTKLHLGCGKRNWSGWINVDGADYPHVDTHNVTDLSIFPDNTFDLVYASHILEYFDRIEVIPVLKEWKRVLKPGGILRLAVPDFEAMVKLYLENGISLDKFLGPLYGRMNMMDEKETIIYHKTTYDYISLNKLLTNDLGFKNFRRYKWEETGMFDNGEDDQSRAYIPHMDFKNGTLISLNIEATK